MSWVDVTTAVGTAGAAVVALGLGLRAEWRAIRAERKQREDDERRQAVHVAAWLLVERQDGRQREEVDTDVVEDPSTELRDARFYVVVRNASDEPIWDVTIHTPGFAEKANGSHELRPVTYQDERVVVGPHETLRLPIARATIPYNRLPIEVQFRDNADRDWRRDDRGRLHRGRTSEPNFADIDEWAKEEKGNI